MAAKKRIPVTRAIIALREAEIPFEPHLYDYEPKGGTRVSSRELGVDEHHIIKTLVMQDHDSSPLVVLQHGDRTVSTKALARALDRRSIVPCAPVVAEKHTGYQVGGTSPFGMKSPLPVYMESSILDLERIFINGGSRGFLVSLDPWPFNPLRRRTRRRRHREALMLARHILFITATVLALTACGDDDKGGAATDAGRDTGTFEVIQLVDTFKPDEDTARPDTRPADTGGLDTRQPDTHIPDTAVADTHTPDTHPADTTQPDTFRPDTHTADTTIADTGAADTTDPCPRIPPPIATATSWSRTLTRMSTTRLRTKCFASTRPGSCTRRARRSPRAAPSSPRSSSLRTAGPGSSPPIGATWGSSTWPRTAPPRFVARRCPMTSGSTTSSSRRTPMSSTYSTVTGATMAAPSGHPHGLRGRLRHATRGRRCEARRASRQHSGLIALVRDGDRRLRRALDGDGDLHVVDLGPRFDPDGGGPLFGRRHSLGARGDAGWKAGVGGRQRGLFGEPNQRVLRDLGRPDPEPRGTIAPFSDPSDIVVSPFGDKILVVEAQGDALVELTYSPGGSPPVTRNGELTYVGPGPALPISGVAITRGSLRGLVLVSENVGVRRVRFESDGDVTDIGAFYFGEETTDIVRSHRRSALNADREGVLRSSPSRI